MKLRENFLIDQEGACQLRTIVCLPQKGEVGHIFKLFGYQFICLFIVYCGSINAIAPNEFFSLSVPMTKDGKIAIPQNFKHIKLDIGLSYNAPMSQYWLSHEDDLIVFGFEPSLTSVDTIKRGSVKRQEFHGDPLELSYIGKSFFILPCALGLRSGEWADFYVTKSDCGCSSLYPPKNIEIEQKIQVPVFRLSDFFDLFPFDEHPVVDYIKIDAQGSDLDIVKGAGHYLAERVIYITIEPENEQYQNTSNSIGSIDSYMNQIGFIRDSSHDTSDPTYFNPRFLDYIRKNEVKIYQRE